MKVKLLNFNIEKILKYFLVYFNKEDFMNKIIK